MVRSVWIVCVWLLLLQCLFSDASDDSCGMSDIKDKISQLEGNISDLQGSVAYFNHFEHLNKSVAEINSITNIIFSLNKTSIEQQRELSILTSGVNKYFKILNETIARQEKQFQTLEPQLATLGNQIVNHTYELAQIQGDWSDLNNQITARDNLFINYNDTYLNLASTLNSQEEKLSKIEQENVLLETEISHTKENNEVFSDFLNTLSSEHEFLVDKIEELRRQLNEILTNPEDGATAICEGWANHPLYGPAPVLDANPGPRFLVLTVYTRYEEAHYTQINRSEEAQKCYQSGDDREQKGYLLCGCVVAVCEGRQCIRVIFNKCCASYNILVPATANMVRSIWIMCVLLQLLQCLFSDASDDAYNISTIKSKIDQFYLYTLYFKDTESYYLKNILLTDPMNIINNLSKKLNTFTSNLTKQNQELDYLNNSKENIIRQEQQFQLLEMKLDTLKNQILKLTSEKLVQLQDNWNILHKNITERENILIKYNDTYFNFSNTLDSRERKLPEIDQNNTSLESNVRKMEKMNEDGSNFLNTYSSKQNILKDKINKLQLQSNKTYLINGIIRICEKLGNPLCRKQD